MNEDFKAVIGNFLRDEYLENRITIERCQEISEEVLDLEKNSSSEKNTKLEIVRLSVKFPEISQIIEKYLTTL